MKNIISTLLVVLGITSGFSQNNGNASYLGDNFSLEGALAMFKKANSLEEFESLLNQQNNNVNNLDLNNDGNIDYITVADMQQGDTHVIVLSTYLNQNEKQDIATIGIERKGENNATLQIEGDQQLYAANTIVEPFDTANNMGNSGGPNGADINSRQIFVNVWGWPSVRFLYAPRYIPWVSPYYWGYYPRWWRPWRPLFFNVFYPRCATYRTFYHPVYGRRVINARTFYAPNRRYSKLILNNRRFENQGRRNGRGNGGRGHRGRGRR